MKANVLRRFWFSTHPLPLSFLLVINNLVVCLYLWVQCMHFEISCNVQFATVFFLIMVSTSSELNNSIDNFRSSFWEEETCISRRRVYYYLCTFTATCKMRKHCDWGTTSPKLYIVVLFDFIEKLMFSHMRRRSLCLCRGDQCEEEHPICIRDHLLSQLLARY